MNYFDIVDNSVITKNVHIYARLHREFIPRSNNIVTVRSGDIIEIVFSKASIIYTFEGICIGVRSKKFRNDKTSLILRNFLMRVGVEVICSFFCTQVFLKFSILDFKRKAFFYIKSKLFYLRKKLNRRSRVK